MLFGKLRSKIKYAVLAAVAVVGLSAAAAPASAQWGISFGGGYGGNGGNGGYGGYNRGSSMHYDRQFHGYSHWTPGRGYHSHGHYDYVPHYTPRNSYGGHRH
jgi:hypothetical protein